jgi:hypothetical protein
MPSPQPGPLFQRGNVFEYYQPPEKTPTDYTGLKIVAILAPVFFAFVFFDKPDMGLSVVIVLGMIVMAVRLHWDMRKHVWFWAVVVIVFLLHLPLFVILRWPQGNTPTITYAMPFGVVGFGIVFGALEVAERVFLRD